VSVASKKNKIQSESQDGYSSIIKGDQSKITAAWYRKLRLLGRLREEGNYIVVRAADIDEQKYPVLPVYSIINSSEKETEIWLYAEVANIETDTAQVIDEKMKELLYSFSLEYYRSIVQNEISEAERAIEFTSKKYQKLLQEEIELRKDSAVNVSEKARLEGLLEKNTLEHKVINQKITDTKAYQDSTLIDMEHMKKALELKKVKFKSIE
jgi:hypothetical protein